MSQSDASPINIFAQAPQLTSEANDALMAWQGTVTSMLQENWQSLLGTDIAISLGNTDSLTAIKAVNDLADPGYAARLQIGPDSFPGLFAFSSRMVLLLVNDMLGTPCEEWPEVRNLTTVETSMVELLMGEVTRAISHAWPEIHPLECEQDCVIARPMRSRVFPPDEVMVRSQVVFETSLGQEEAIWLMPQSGLATIGIDDVTSEEVHAEPAPQIRALVEQIPVKMVARLGDTTMSLAELDSLKVGDYLTLDQSVCQPMELTVDGRLQWLGHPCRLGTRQGFQIIASSREGVS
ncbi:MAG: FliM/FliN family flagellar motor switch protein [Fuerstiella sp.]|jgi:flagellar motor switch protein FliM|nr:FliM/FliN family flagellar motor switch protein [Fuerstiella sp.]